MEDRHSQSLSLRIRNGPLWMGGFIALLWAIELVNLVVQHQLLRFGILPRTLDGLRGIVFAPFLHDGLGHLVANTVPLFLLGWLVLTRGHGVFLRATVFIALVGGALTWVFGRPSYHVGASSLIFGYLGFLIASAWHERRPLQVLLALIATTLYGGILWGLLPLAAGVSWEGHLFGFVAGLLAVRSGLVSSNRL